MGYVIFLNQKLQKIKRIGLKKMQLHRTFLAKPKVSGLALIKSGIFSAAKNKLRPAIISIIAVKKKKFSHYFLSNIESPNKIIAINAGRKA